MFRIYLIVKLYKIFCNFLSILRKLYFLLLGGLFDDENVEEDVYEFKPTKKRATKPRASKKTATKASERELKFKEQSEKEWAERAKEYAELKDYKLIVEHVDHDY